MPFYLLFAVISEHVLCADISAYGLKIIMLYVVILFNSLRQCVGDVSLCDGFMAHVFLFACIGEYVLCA